MVRQLPSDAGGSGAHQRDSVSKEIFLLSLQHPEGRGRDCGWGIERETGRGDGGEVQGAEAEGTNSTQIKETGFHFKEYNKAQRGPRKAEMSLGYDSFYLLGIQHKVASRCGK